MRDRLGGEQDVLEQAVDVALVGKRGADPVELFETRQQVVPGKVLKPLARQIDRHAGQRTVELPMFDMGLADTAYPFLLFLAARVKQLSGANSGEKSKITIPWFAILFIVVAIFNSFHLLPQSVVNMLVTLDTFLLAMAMAALGLTTHVSALKKAGAKPLLMALVLFAWLIVGGGAINYVIQSVIA